MPAFTFEKISPSARREPPSAAPETKPSGVLVKMLGHLPRSRTRKNKRPTRQSESGDGIPAQD
jgi:hypothetical protein